MLASATCYAPAPLLIALTGGAQHAFLFNGIYRVGALIAALAYLAIQHRDLLARRDVRQAILGRTLRPDIVLVIAPYFSFTAATWSARYVDISVTTIVHETWPAIFIPLTERLLRREGRFRRPTPAQMALVALAFTGLVLAVQSQGNAQGTHTGGGNVPLGVALASLLSAATSYNFRWAMGLRDMIPGEHDTLRLELFCVMVAFSIGTAVSALLNTGLGLLTGPGGATAGTGSLLAGALAGGLLLDTTGTVLERTANLTTSITTTGYENRRFMRLHEGRFAFWEALIP